MTVETEATMSGYYLLFKPGWVTHVVPLAIFCVNLLLILMYHVWMWYTLRFFITNIIGLMTLALTIVVTVMFFRVSLAAGIVMLVCFLLHLYLIVAHTLFSRVSETLILVGENDNIKHGDEDDVEASKQLINDDDHEKDQQQHTTPPPPDLYVVQ